MQKKTDIEKLNDFWLRVAAFPIISIICNFFFYAEENVNYNISITKGIIVSFIVAVLNWELARQILMYYRRKYPNIDQTKNRVLFTLFGFIVLSFVLNGVLHFFYSYTYMWNRIETFKDYIFNVCVFIFFLVILYAIYEMMYFFRKWKQTFEEREKLQEEKQHSQLLILQSQINPHFLFNSLNVLEMLAEGKDENTVPFIRQLAAVYRYILQNQAKELNSVKEELNFIKAYSFLLETRFGNNLRLIMDVPEQYYTKLIPPLTLQLLVENAMKHNIASASKPLTIHVMTEGNQYLVVKNNLQRKTQSVPSNKIGLENIKQRYALLGNKAIKISTDNKEFSVAIPMLEGLLMVNEE